MERTTTICGTTCSFAQWRRGTTLAANSNYGLEPTVAPTPPKAPEPSPEAPPSTLPPYTDYNFHIIAFKLYFNDAVLFPEGKDSTGPVEETIGHLHESTVLSTHAKAKLFASHLAFAAASSGTQTVLIPKEDIDAFIVQHSGAIFVTQNAAFEYHITRLFLTSRSTLITQALEAWFEVANDCRLRDVFILDILIRLALDDGSPKPRTLLEIAIQYIGLELTDPAGVHYKFAQRFFPETKSTSYASSDRKRPMYEDSLGGFAVRDVVVFQLIYSKMHQIAYEITKKYQSEVFAGAFTIYGPLTEGIQVKGNLVLSEVTRNGISINTSQVGQIRAKMEAKLQKSVQKLQTNPAYAGLFHLTVGDGGMIVPIRESGKPSIIKAKLEQILLKAAVEISDKYQIDVTIPYTEEGTISLSTKAWSEYLQYHEFVGAWVEMEQAAHFASFLLHLKEDRVHPEYSIMVRNGRSAAQNPPIQQTPRKGGFREIFQASPGHVLVTVDYDFIELCTLAAVCLANYHFSVLADVIKQGIDPHGFTAAMIEGVDVKTFMSWKNSDDAELKTKFATLRQKAKAVNFGIPSGLSAAGLSMYAKAAYGAELSMQDAETFRKKLTEEIYPEIGIYLKDSDMQRLAENLKVPEKVCWDVFSFGKDGARSPAIEGGIRNIVRGKTHRKKDGKPYNAYFAKKIWNGLKHLTRDPALLQVLQKANNEGNEQVFKALFGRPVCTLTGRVRGKVGFTQARNTPFSGLAADGAKLAMWNLTALGYRLIGFIHDEILIELPKTPTNTYTQEVKRIEEIICKSMQELTGPIPISCSAAVSYVWSKQAVATYNSQGELIPWEQPPEHLNASETPASASQASHSAATQAAVPNGAQAEGQAH